MNSKNTSNATIGSDEISFKELILRVKGWYRYLLSKWVVIVGFGILGGLLGFVYAYFKKPIYTATTTFVLEEDKAGGGLGSLAGLASIAGVDLGSEGGGIFRGDNILELYRSRKMIEKTLMTSIEYEGKKELLIDCYIRFNSLREKWKKKNELKEIQFKSIRRQSSKSDRDNSRLQDSILGVIVTDINKYYLNVSKPDKKLSIISAEVKAPDEFFAKTFNDQIVKNVNDFYIQTKTRKSLENLAILQHQTDSVRNVLNGAIYTGAAVVDATPNLNPTRQILRTPAQRSQFNAEANKAILTQLVQNLELAKISLRKEMPLIQVIDNPVLPLSKDIFGKKKGLILGGLLFSFLSIVAITIAKMLKSILSQ